MTDITLKALENYVQGPHSDGKYALLDLDVALFAQCSTATKD